MKTTKSNSRTTILTLCILLAALASFYIYLKQGKETEVGAANTPDTTSLPVTDTLQNIDTNSKKAEKERVMIDILDPLDPSDPVYPEPVKPDTIDPGGPIRPYPIVYEPIELPPPDSELSEDSNKIYSVVEQMPEFIGGNNELTVFISKNIEYPKTAAENGIEGTIILGFVVERDGSISDIKVLKKVHEDLDNESIRVIKLTDKRWNPGKLHGGKIVRAEMRVPIRFKLR